MIGAECMQPIQLRRGAGAGHDLRAGLLGKLHAAHADAAAGTQDHHLVAGAHIALRHQHAMRRAIRDRQRRGIDEADVVGNPHQLMRARAAQLGETAMHGLAHQPAFHAVDRIDQHAIADRPALDTGTDRGDLAGDVEAHDQRHRHLDARHAATGEHVVVIQRRGAHADQHVAFADLSDRESR